MVEYLTPTIQSSQRIKLEILTGHSLALKNPARFLSFWGLHYIALPQIHIWVPISWKFLLQLKILGKYLNIQFHVYVNEMGVRKNILPIGLLVTLTTSTNGRTSICTHLEDYFKDQGSWCKGLLQTHETGSFIRSISYKMATEAILENYAEVVFNLKFEQLRTEDEKRKEEKTKNYVTKTGPK